VVFIDGLGDLTDIQTPLPQLSVLTSGAGAGVGASSAELATYSIVVTTLERCTIEYRRLIALSAAESDAAASSIFSEAARNSCPYLVAMRALF
jgi:hypothetical protein